MVDTLTSEEFGIFYNGVPIMVGSSALASVYYFSFVRPHAQLALFLLTWYVIVLFTALNYTFVSGLKWDLANDTTGVLVGNGLFSIPIIIFMMTFKGKAYRFKTFILEEVPAAHLIATKASRIAGAVYVYLYYKQHVYNYIALQVGVFDMTVSLLALPLAEYIRRVGLKKAKTLVLAYNVFGIMDLAIPFSLFTFNLFDVLYTPEQSLSFFFIYPIPIIFLYNVPLAGITHMLFLTNFDVMEKAEINKGEDNKQK